MFLLAQFLVVQDINPDFLHTISPRQICDDFSKIQIDQKLILITCLALKVIQVQASADLLLNKY